MLGPVDAGESTGAMEMAFSAEKVDLSIVGDWEDAQILLRLLTQRKTSPDCGLWDEFPSPGKSILSATKKKKKEKTQQKKMERKSRKRNRRKRYGNSSENILMEVNYLGEKYVLTTQIP
jgi:hypothetical protein